MCHIKKLAFVFALASLCFFAVAENHAGAFSGSYSIGSVVKQGETVHVTMNFRLFNGTALDLRNARIILSDHQPALPPKGGITPGAMMPINNHGSASIAALRTHRDIELKDVSFNVPAFEYQQWQMGARPVFVLSYQTANGGQVQRPVELARER